MNRPFYQTLLLSLVGMAIGIAAALLLLLVGASVTSPDKVQAQSSGQAGAVISHKPGSLARDGQTIFLIGRGYKQGFTSLNEFLTYNYRLSRIVAMNQGDRDLVEGPAKRAKPGSLVLDSSDGRTVYLIGKQGEKRGLSSATAYWRYKKKSTVLWKIDLTNYPVGETIE